MKTWVKIILGIWLTLAFGIGSLFASKDEDTKTPSKSQTGQTEIKTGTKTTSDEDNSEKEVKKEINAYIIEAYKLQWAKILKDIDSSLQKLDLDDEGIREAYQRIRDTLDTRRKKLQSSDTLSENSKEILSEYLAYMIVGLNKRIKDLK